MNLVQQFSARITDYLYAGWRQVAGWVSRAHPRDFVSGSLTPVLVIPGVYEPWQFMLPLIRELHTLGHPVHVVEKLGNNRASVSAAAQIVAVHLVDHDLRDTIIVAHSKGGLIGKHVMGFSVASARVLSMIAIAAPFGGSRYARLLPGRAIRSFRPGDETLARLALELETNAHIVSLYPRFDPHIPEGSELAGAHNVCLETSGHFSILRNSEARAEVLKAVSTR